MDLDAYSSIAQHLKYFNYYSIGQRGDKHKLYIPTCDYQVLFNELVVLYPNSAESSVCQVTEQVTRLYLDVDTNTSRDEGQTIDLDSVWNLTRTIDEILSEYLSIPNIVGVMFVNQSNNRYHIVFNGIKCTKIQAWKLIKYIQYKLSAINPTFASSIDASCSRCSLRLPYQNKGISDSSEYKFVTIVDDKYVVENNPSVAIFEIASIHCSSTDVDVNLNDDIYYPVFDNIDFMSIFKCGIDAEFIDNTNNWVKYIRALKFVKSVYPELVDDKQLLNHSRLCAIRTWNQTNNIRIYDSIDNVDVSDLLELMRCIPSPSTMTSYYKNNANQRRIIDLIMVELPQYLNIKDAITVMTMTDILSKYVIIIEDVVYVLDLNTKLWEEQGKTILTSMITTIFTIFSLKRASSSIKAPSIQQVCQLGKSITDLLTDRCRHIKLNDIPDSTLPFFDGIVNLRTGELSKISNDQYITRYVKHLYHDINNVVVSDVVANFFRSITKDEESYHIFKRHMGYLITGSNPHRKVFEWYGQTSNGKSLCVNIFMQAFREFVTSANYDFMQQSKSNRGGGNPLLLSLSNYRVAFIQESQTTQLDSALLKVLSGNDYISERYLYSNQYIKKQFATKLVMIHNMRINTATLDEAVLARLDCYDFPITFVNHRNNISDNNPCIKIADNNMYDKLLMNIESVIKWVIEGAIDYYNNTDEFAARNVFTYSRIHSTIVEYVHLMMCQHLICDGEEDKQLTIDDILSCIHHRMRVDNKYNQDSVSTQMVVDAIMKSKFKQSYDEHNSTLYFHTWLM